MPKKNEYSGILAEKLPTREHLPFLPYEEFMVHFADLLEQKMEALFAHYNIQQMKDSGDKQKLKACETLLMQVAREHIPGFQFENTPQRWMGSDGIILFLDVIGKAKQRDWNFSWACQQLVKTDKYKGEKWRTLYSRFMEQRTKNEHIAQWFDTDNIDEKRRVCNIIERTADELYKQ